MLYTICFETGHLFYNLVLAYVLGGLTMILVSGFEKEYKKALLNKQQMRGAYYECNEDIDSTVYCIDEVTGDIEVFTDNTPERLEPCPDRQFGNPKQEVDNLITSSELPDITEVTYKSFTIRQLKDLAQDYNKRCRKEDKLKGWDRLIKRDLYNVLVEREVI